MIGEVLDGRYRLEAKLGKGGMGEVYLARHLLMDQPVAIKLLVAAERPDAARRFVREAKSSFLLDHPGCVRVLDLGVTDGGLLYLVMEYLDGRTVGAELSVDGPLAPRRALHIARQVAAALGHAHGHGLVHRDLKPDNIMLVRRGDDADFAKVLDFGLARAFDASLARGVSITPLTQQGLVFGTPEYMSPEQALGEAVGPTSDLYALGAVLYHMVTGAPPFVARQPMEVLSGHVRGEVAPPSRRRPDLGLDRALDALVLSLLARRPEDRPPDAAAAAGRIAEHLSRSTGVPRPAGPAETIELSPASAAIPGAAGVVARRARGQRRARRVSAVIVALSLAGTVGGALSKRRGRVTLLPPRAVVERAPAPLPGVASLDPPAPAVPAAAPPTALAAAIVEAPDPAAGRRAGAERHVKAAEQARRAGNLLRQLAEADEALRLDPKNRRARELVGEALVRSGDKARGCAYLESGGRTFAAVGCAD